MAHRKGAAETAALARTLEIRDGDVGERAQQLLRLLLHPHFTLAVTGAVEGHRDRTAMVAQRQLADMHQEPGQLVNPAGKGSGLRFIGLTGEQLGIMLVHHAGTAAGRHHHRDRLGKACQLLAGHRPRLIKPAIVARRLAATGLTGRKDHSDALTPEQLHAGQPGAGVKQVNQTGRKKIDRLGFLRNDTSHHSPLRQPAAARHAAHAVNLNPGPPPGAGQTNERQA